MDLASGYSDSFNYGNGYTPLANNAINNNNAEYLRNQLAAQQAGMYNPFAQSGGFGAMTDYYSGLGRDYTTATGGNIFGNASGGGGNQISGGYYDTPAGKAFLADFGMGGIGSDAARAPSQPQPAWDPYASFNDRFSAAPAVDYRLQPTPAQQLPQGMYDGVFAPTTPRAVTIGDDFQSRFGNWGGGGAAQPQPQQQPQQQQPNNLPPFWQGFRDMFGADPKDQSRVPQDTGTYPGATNPNYQPGGMTPQQPFQPWVNAS